MRRFFIDSGQITGTEAVLSGAEAHHLVKVLRLQAGAEVCLLDGGGKVFDATVAAVSRSEVRLHILRTREEPLPLSLLTLGVALVKGGKMDLVIQKATELGVHAILPFHSRYCDLRPGAESRKERWQRVALEACKQCGRSLLPLIGEVMEFPAAIEQGAGLDLKCLLWEQAGPGKRLRDVFRRSAPARSAIVLIGPEGGFHPEEAERAIRAGYRPLTLGNRVLRAETAAIAAAAIFQYELGNLERTPSGTEPCGL